MIVARGGGSLADLLCFCDETLCRTVALLGVPVIASVGHHTDRTLLDDVAAFSCSTPTHAAEAAVAVDCARRARRARARAARRLRDHGRRAVARRARGCSPASRAPRPPTSTASARACTSSCARSARARAGAAGRRARGDAARARWCCAQGRLDAVRLPRARAPRELERLALALAGHDPQRTLERGYALVRSPPASR